MNATTTEPSPTRALLLTETNLSKVLTGLGRANDFLQMLGRKDDVEALEHAKAIVEAVKLLVGDGGPHGLRAREPVDRDRAAIEARLHLRTLRAARRP